MNKNEELCFKILKTKYLLTYEANKLSKFVFFGIIFYISPKNSWTFAEFDLEVWYFEVII